MLTPDDLLKIEEKSLVKVAGQWKLNVLELNKAVQLLLATTPKEDFPKVIEQVRNMLQGFIVTQGMDTEALRSVQVAHEFGLSMFEQATGKKPGKIKVSNNSKKAVTGLDESAVLSLQKAIANINSQEITSMTKLNLALAPLLQNPAKVESAVAWSVNNASNSALSKLAKQSGERLTWISERNGCASCLAYSGKHATSNGFPKGLTFAKKPITVPGNTLPHPPLHPRCRCSVEVGISDDYAEALERESVRSILKGFKMPSESEKVRIEAAERLLEKNPVAPASVIKYSRNKIKKFELKQQKKTK